MSYPSASVRSRPEVGCALYETLRAYGRSLLEPPKFSPSLLLSAHLSQHNEEAGSPYI